MSSQLNERGEAELAIRLPASKRGAMALRQAPAEAKNVALLALRDLLLKHEAEILEANAKDVARAEGKVTAAFLDRLRLTPSRLAGMRASLDAVASLEDPVGEIIDRKTLPNGVELQRVRAPLGVIFMIFEARPNVAIEAFSLALKSGNAMILRGGSDSRESTKVLYRLASEAFAKVGLPESALWGLDDPDRAWANRLLRERNFIDVVVPRGSERLIEFVVENSRIPIIKNDRGLCHLYLHGKGDVEMAARIALNGKTQRPSTCNSLETILVDASVAKTALPRLHRELASMGVRWMCEPRAHEILAGLPGVESAAQSTFDIEHLDLIVNCAVVDGLDAALAHIEKHGSRHSEAIVTADRDVAERFLREVDAAATYWNASTRFTDGYEFGLGGELGISTQKLHARGPVGLRELTSARWIGRGTGQTRD